MKVSTQEQIDVLNIGLLFLAGIIAVIVPFELFLFSYAILGPLHYLTEISWLHDRGYFTKRKYDAVFLGSIAVGIGLIALYRYYHLQIIPLPSTIESNLGWIAFLLAILFVTVKKYLLRIIGVILILLTIEVSNRPGIIAFTTIFLPTLVHIYVFTGLFMLYGALKSNSRMGLYSVLIFIIIPILLVTAVPANALFGTTEYSKNIYMGSGSGLGFHTLHIDIMKRFFSFGNLAAGTNAELTQKWMDAIFNSPTGIIIGRIIAFSYTYHYLNWFSKTKVIQWHVVPKKRFVFVILAWLFSIYLYTVNFTFAFIWLATLSYLHVLLEFPLNVTSVVGIYGNLKARLSK